MQENQRIRVYLRIEKNICTITNILLNEINNKEPRQDLQRNF